MSEACSHKGQRAWINYRYIGQSSDRLRRYNVLRCRACGKVEETLMEADWDGQLSSAIVKLNEHRKAKG